MAETHSPEAALQAHLQPSLEYMIKSLGEAENTARVVSTHPDKALVLPVL